ncbi:Protein of unknown function [Gryllus bimaculatus]|nr:Protein of unknown function [Gryllus bimaculatus]
MEDPAPQRGGFSRGGRGRGGPGGRGGPPRGRGMGDGMRGRGGRGGMMRGGPQGRGGRGGPPRGGGMSRGGDRGGFGGPGGRFERGRGMGMRGGRGGDFSSRGGGSSGEGRGSFSRGRGGRGMDRGGRGGRGGFDRGGRGGMGQGDRYGPSKRGGMPPQGGPMAKRGRFDSGQGANGYPSHPRGEASPYPSQQFAPDHSGSHYDSPAADSHAPTYGGAASYGGGASQPYSSGGGSGGYSSSAGYEGGEYGGGGYNVPPTDTRSAYGVPPPPVPGNYGPAGDAYSSYKTGRGGRGMDRGGRGGKRVDLIEVVEVMDKGIAMSSKRGGMPPQEEKNLRNARSIEMRKQLKDNLVCLGNEEEGWMACDCQVGLQELESFLDASGLPLQHFFTGFGQHSVLVSQEHLHMIHMEGVEVATAVAQEATTQPLTTMRGATPPLQTHMVVFSFMFIKFAVHR